MDIYMSTMSQFFGGGDAIPPIDGTMMLNNFDSLVTLGGGTFLKSGVVEDDPSVYPAAYVTNGEFNISAASYTGNSFSVASQDTSPQSIVFNTDGTKMFMVGFINYTVYEYTLSTAFNISTASYTGNSFSVAGQDLALTAIAFNTDGTKMFIVGTNNDAIYEYTLGTAFNVSTASYSGNNFSVASQENLPQSIVFNTDGTKMFIVGTTNDTVYEYTLSTAFSVSTAAYSGNSFSVATQETAPAELAFNNDGTKLFIVGSSRTINEYAPPAAEWVGSPISYSEGAVNQYVRIA